MNNQQLTKHDSLGDISLSVKGMPATKDVKVDMSTFTSFAFFMSFVYMTTFFSHAGSFIPNLYNWLIGIKGIGALLCVGVFLEHYWPTWLKQRLSAYWHFTLFYCLPFSFTFLLLLNAYSIEWIVCISLALTLLLVMVNWRTFVWLTLGGVALVLGLYWLCIGPFPALSTDRLYLLVYSCSFSIAMGLIFSRRKEQSLTVLQLRNQQLLEEQQKNRQELLSTLKNREILLAELPTYLDENVARNQGVMAFVQQMLYRMTDYMRLEVTYVSTEAIEKAIKEIRKLQSPNETTVFLLQQETQYAGLQADFNKLKQLLHNAISYIQQHHVAGNSFTIAIEDAVLGHDVAHMPNHIRTLEALKITLTSEGKIPPTKSLYKINLTKSSTWIPQQEDEFLLVENARIVDAHYGYLDVKSSPHTHVYVLPVKLREIRGKVMELIQEPAVADPEELKHPLAIQLEKELIDKLAGTQVNISTINTALDLIKRYHGGVKRKSGEPFFTHPISVALILLEYSQDQDAILGALLHDTIEDTNLTLAQIRKLFGETVEFLVAKATNLEGYKNRASLPDYENIVRIMNYEDPRAALVKLSDRLHNMRTIQHHPQLSKQKSIAKETLDYFVPLARQLHLHPMAEELERLSQEVIAKKE
jgi:hypothetical protein